MRRTAGELFPSFFACETHLSRSSRERSASGARRVRAVPRHRPHPSRSARRPWCALRGASPRRTREVYVVPDPIYTFSDRCGMCRAGRSVPTGSPCYILLGMIPDAETMDAPPSWPAKAGHHGGASIVSASGITVQPLPLSVGVYSDIVPVAPYTTWPVGFDPDGATVPT